MRDLTGRASKAFAFAALAAIVAAASAGAQDVRIRVAPDILIPIADSDTFGLGGGGSFVMDMDVLGFMAPYLGADIRYVSPASSDSSGSLMLASGGLGLGVFAFPLPRIKIGASGGSGIYVGSYTDPSGDPQMSGNVFWKAGAELGYRVSPSFTISAGASYIDLLNKVEGLVGSFYKGVSVSLVADIGLGSKNSEGRAALQSSESTPVYPIVAFDYAKGPFGAVSIRNAETAEIRDVEIWFRAEGYTAGPVLCAKVPYLGKGGVTSAPLLADFSDQVMSVTENVKVRGEVQISYTLLGEPRTAKAETTISIMHRNALTWADPKILASFVSPNDPAVLDSSKFLAGVIRSKARMELDSNLQYALGIFEGLRLTGIAWTADPQTPYARMRSAPTEVDYVQYPYQTIAYRGGDSDDIAALYAAELESVGVPAALLPLDAEVLVAFKMTGAEAATKSSFSDSGDFIFVDGEAWAPVKVSALREGFLRAWSEGAALVKSTPNARERFYKLADAWRRYPPAGVPGITAATKKPSEDQVRAAFDNAVSLVVAKEVTPRAERMKLSFGPDGGTGRQRNSLGVLYARYGMYAQALAEFQAAARLGHESAAVNIGNVAFLTGDYKTAAAWFEKATADRPEDVAAIIGLARSLYELDRYEEADALFRKATDYIPELAERYGYLSAKLTGSTARASAVMDRGGGMLWDD
ncbi:MAG: tetratricopeptide repeat protein [Spirochaetes bacterium]|nr:tetratricopeptide repeat protein [Spirochaetota bacterium]MBU1079162.1 tetratricopeptide repeat protein [Spirochaetota bacterium]